MNKLLSVAWHAGLVSITTNPAEVGFLLSGALIRPGRGCISASAPLTLAPKPGVRASACWRLSLFGMRAAAAQLCRHLAETPAP